MGATYDVPSIVIRVFRCKISDWSERELGEPKKGRWGGRTAFSFRSIEFKSCTVLEI